MTPTPLTVSQLPLAIRDTALTVAGLRAGDLPHDGFAVFRQRCEAQLVQLRAELVAAGQPADVIDDALYAQCALLDEAVLHCLKTEHREEWERQPLQVEQFSSHDAGEQLISRMQARLSAPLPNKTLLLIFHTVLLLGFKGKFFDLGDPQRIQLMSEIAKQLNHGNKKHVAENTSMIVVSGKRSRCYWPGFSPLFWVILASLVAAALYLALQRWLTSAITALAQ